jgi:hypothetical protein
MILKNSPEYRKYHFKDGCVLLASALFGCG